MTTAEEPAITISLRRTKNPLAWGVTLIRLVATAGLTTLGCIILPHGPAGLIFALPGAVLLWVEIRRILWVDQSVYRFFADRLAIDRRAPRKPRGEENYPLDKICHLELAALDQLRIEILVGKEWWQRETIVLPSTSGEDTFDACVEHLQQGLSDHLCSFAQPKSLLLTRDVELATLLPDLAAPVREARGRILAQPIQVGALTLVPEYRVPMPGFGSEGRFDIRLRDEEHRTVALVIGGGLRTATGIMVARIRKPSGHGSVDVEIADGSVYHVHRRRIEEAGTDVADHRPEGSEVVVRFASPLPGVVALALLIAVLDGRPRMRLAGR